MKIYPRFGKLRDFPFILQKGAIFSYLSRASVSLCLKFGL